MTFLKKELSSRMTAVSLLVACLPALALAQALPETLAFRARVGNGGVPAAGTSTFVFKLFPTISGGTEVWAETQSLTVAAGEVSTLLGTTLPLTDQVFTGAPLFLEVAIDGTTLSPRSAITTVPYAQRASVAGKLGSLTPADLQRRVTGVCAPNNSIRAIADDGTVTCQPSGAGPAGPQGPAGATGPAGAQGPIGMTGPAGAQGPIGMTGPVGAQGPQGTTGLTGATGPTGLQGTTGLTGATGPTGPVGPQGTAGSNSLWTSSGTNMSFTTSGGRVGIGAGTSSPGGLLQVSGPIRAGSETGTTDAPTLNIAGSEFSYSGIVTRRVVSGNLTANSIVARTNVMQIERDGTPGGMRFRWYASGPAVQSVRGIAMSQSGTLIAIRAEAANAFTGGVQQLFADADSIIWAHLFFGNLYNASHTAELTISRSLAFGSAAEGGRYWTGHLVTTFDQ